jgi:Zn ribbon nucleic-acid-binding protein
MIAFKACPRCHGDLLAGLDDEVTCIQCGYELKPAERQAIVFSRPRSERRRELVAA